MILVHYPRVHLSCLRSKSEVTLNWCDTITDADYLSCTMQLLYWKVPLLWKNATKLRSDEMPADWCYLHPWPVQNRHTATSYIISNAIVSGIFGQSTFRYYFHYVLFIFHIFFHVFQQNFENHRYPWSCSTLLG